MTPLWALGGDDTDKSQRAEGGMTLLTFRYGAAPLSPVAILLAILLFFPGRPSPVRRGVRRVRDQTSDITGGDVLPGCAIPGGPVPGHGISGNGLCIHHLFRWGAEPVQLRRADPVRARQGFHIDMALGCVDADLHRAVLPRAILPQPKP